MHRLLIRQLRHILGIEDAEHWLALNQAIGDFAVNLAHDNPLLAQAVTRMPALLERISNTYAQHERHLSLLRSSLETASRELREAQEALRTEISHKTHPLESLQCVTRCPEVRAGGEHDDADCFALAERSRSGAA